MSSKKTLKVILALTVAAILPLSLYMLMRSLNDGHIEMPKYYRIESIQAFEKDGKKVMDTVFHTVKDIALTNQLGEKISLNHTLKDKVLVIDFVFTRCGSICPSLSTAMSQLQKAYKKKKPDWVQFITITVDPEHDSVAVMRTYADRYGADHDRWYFLTGNKDEIFDYAKNELGVVLQPADGSSDIVHTENIILLDPNRHIRGYYNGLDAKEISVLANNIAILKLEKKRKNN